MKVAVQGTKKFNDYTVFMRAMGVALSSVDEEFIVYSAGPATVNSFASEFINKSEGTLKAQGIKAKYLMVPPSFIQDNIADIDYFAFFSEPNQNLSALAVFAEFSGVDVGVFRY
jgi:hypothetical protein